MRIVVVLAYRQDAVHIAVDEETEDHYMEIGTAGAMTINIYAKGKGGTLKKSWTFAPGAWHTVYLGPEVAE